MTARHISRDRKSGRYDSLDAMCRCGHRKGVHTAEKPHECIAHDFGAVICGCKGFKLARKKNPRAKRVKNPRMQAMFVLLATKGKTVLKYVGGVRFSSKGRAVLFPTRQAATMAARDLRSRFPVLKGYTLRVQS